MVTASYRIAAAASLCLVASAAQAKPEYTVLHRFTGADGSYPVGAVIWNEAEGAMYGTTGGSDRPKDHGTVFRLTPPKPGQSEWKQTIFHKFTGKPDGAEPESAVTADGTGALYGTTENGGADDKGTIYKLTPPAPGKADWTYTQIYSFKGGADGANPRAPLVLDSAGALYGTTASYDVKGRGSVFKLTPPAAGANAKWTKTVLYHFTGKDDGAYPRGGVTFGSGGVLYGTASGGGAKKNGVVFQLTPPAGKQAWKQSVLYTFTGGADGGAPDPGVLLDSDTGILYGTAYFGGGIPNGSGVVYSLTPPKTAGGRWAETVLHAFAGGADGGHPYEGALVRAPNGTLYGTTQGYNGNAHQQGTAYALAPPKAGSAEWREVILHKFSSEDGSPDSGLQLVPRGLFGTTYNGGQYGKGTVYTIVLYTPLS